MTRLEWVCQAGRHVNIEKSQFRICQTPENDPVLKSARFPVPFTDAKKARIAAGRAPRVFSERIRVKDHVYDNGIRAGILKLKLSHLLLLLTRRSAGRLSRCLRPDRGRVQVSHYWN